MGGWGGRLEVGESQDYESWETGWGGMGGCMKNIYMVDTVLGYDYRIRIMDI